MKSSDSNYPICRHIKTNGYRCGSPALTTSAFCHFHQRFRRTRMSAVASGPGLSPNVLHSLRNAQSIQDALAMIISGLDTGQLQPNQAGRMLQAIHMAQSTLPATPFE